MADRPRNRLLHPLQKAEVTVSVVMSDLIKMDGLHKLIKEAYEAGFQDGADHNNLDWKYPPMPVAFLIYRKNQFYPLGPCILTRDELKEIAAWDSQSYSERCKINNADMDKDES